MLDGVQWKLLIGLHSWMTFCFVKGIKALLFCLFAEKSQSQCGMHTKHPPLPSHREIMARLQCRHCGQSGSYSRVPITSVAAVVAHTFTCSQSSSPFSSSSSSSFPQWHCLCARDWSSASAIDCLSIVSASSPSLFFPLLFSRLSALPLVIQRSSVFADAVVVGVGVVVVHKWCFSGTRELSQLSINSLSESSWSILPVLPLSFFLFDIFSAETWLSETQ